MSYSQPITETWKGCPGEGDGGDPAQNRLKNRIDVPPQYNQVALDWVIELPYPKSIAAKLRSRWTPEERKAVAGYEGMGITIEGYVVGDKHSGPESCNCHSTTDRDYHLYLAAAPGLTKAATVVCEISPRVQVLHPEWVPSVVQGFVRTSRRVRLSGWLMMDPEHIDQVGLYRATPWEIHPITKIEVWSLGTWRTPAPWWHALKVFAKALVGK